MKKVLFAVFAFALIFAACEKTTEPVPEVSSFKLEVKDSVGTDLAANPLDYHMDVINDGDTDLAVTWKATEGGSNPAGWIVQVCDNVGCYTTNLTSTSSMTIGVVDTVDVKVTVDPQSARGSGTVDVMFYLPADSAATVVSQTINHTAS